MRSRRDRQGQPDVDERDAQHAAEHDRLLLQLGHFQKAYQDGEPTARELTIDTTEFFRHWLLAHIQQEDMLYKPYVMKIS